MNVYGFLLMPYGKPDGELMQTILAARTRNEAMLRLRTNGLIPEYVIVTETEIPAIPWLQSIFVQAGFFAKLRCRLTGGHDQIRYQPFGVYCTKCKGVWPEVRQA